MSAHTEAMYRLLDAFDAAGFKAYGVAFPTGQAYITFHGDPDRALEILDQLADNLTPALADQGEEG